jgi:hypothetical protein
MRIKFQLFVFGMKSTYLLFYKQISASCKELFSSVAIFKTSITAVFLFSFSSASKLFSDQLLSSDGLFYFPATLPWLASEHRNGSILRF